MIKHKNPIKATSNTAVKRHVTHTHTYSHYFIIYGSCNSSALH